jgi:hypothetical protein
VPFGHCAYILDQLIKSWYIQHSVNERKRLFTRVRRIAEPDTHFCCISIDVSHPCDLIISLFCVRLVNAEGVYPQDTNTIWKPQMLQRSEEIRSDIEPAQLETGQRDAMAPDTVRSSSH